MKKKLKKQEADEQPYTSGVIVFPGSKKPDVWLLHYCCGEPVVEDGALVDPEGRILFCTREELLPDMLRQGVPELVSLGPMRDRKPMIYNLRALCKAIRNEKKIAWHHLDTLILIMDCFASIDKNEELDYAIGRLYCSIFETDYIDQYLEESGKTSADVLDMIIQSIGYIAAHGRFITRKKKGK